MYDAWLLPREMCHDTALTFEVFMNLRVRSVGLNRDFDLVTPADEQMKGLVGIKSNVDVCHIVFGSKVLGRHS